MFRYLFYLFSIYSLLPGCTTNNNTPPYPAASDSTYHEKDYNLVWKKIDSLKAQLKSADLVERSDDDFTSAALISFSKKDQTFSHCGLIFYEDSAWYVYHIMAGAENPSETIMRQRFESFADPKGKTGIGIFRYRLSPEEIDDLHMVMKKYYADKMKFDKAFDLKTDDKMYCAEIISKSLARVTRKRIQIIQTIAGNISPKITRVAGRDFKGAKYIALDDLYLNDHCKEIDRIKYASYIK